MMDSLIPSLWAKSSPRMSLRTHLICTGIVAQRFMSAPSSRSILSYFEEGFEVSRAEAIGVISYLCALHDIGKAHPVFQRKSPECSEGLNQAMPSLFDHEHLGMPFRHEYYSAKVASRIWKCRGVDRKTIRTLSCVLSLHHQKPNPGLANPRVENPFWESLQDSLEAELAAVFLGGSPLKTPRHTDAACMLLTAILILCDWVSSSTLFANADQMAEAEWHTLADHALRLYGLISDDMLPWRTDFHSLWPEIEHPRPLQTACNHLDFNAGLTIIEAPMGEGKTEAALYLADQLCHAHHKRGLYMALPSQATSNQMYQRLNLLLGSLSYGEARLLHGNADVIANVPSSFQTEDEKAAALWTRPTRMGLLGANAVGTVDQAMATVLLSPFSMIRLVGLANKTLIIDEIHAYDMYMSEIIEVLLHWCHDLKVPVILLSATMRREQRERYVQCYGSSDPGSEAYPLITQVDLQGHTAQTPVDAFSHYHYRFEPVKQAFDPHRIAEDALNSIADGGCIAVLVNTVSHAQQVFIALQELSGGDVQLRLFHSRYPLGRRIEIEEDCVNAFGRDRSGRPKKAVLVATQVVEQSIDLDFDGIVSELAPIDLLLQRAGRLHRHRDQRRPEGFSEPVMKVLLPPDDASEKLENRYDLSGYVYDPYLLYNTEQQLKEPRTIRIPEDIRALIEEAYSSLTPQNREEWFKRTVKGQLETEQAKGCAWPKPEEDSFFPSEQPVFFAVEDREDGFSSSGEAATRLGEKSMRIAFCDESLFNKAAEDHLSPSDIQTIYMSSLSIRPPRSGFSDLSQVRILSRGKLAGVHILRGTKQCSVGNYTFKYSPDLGVSWEESL